MTKANTTQRLEVVRAEVRKLLDKSAAFHALPPERRREIANDMVKTVSYMAESQALAERVSAVDFPAFVSGLIEGVFQAIVTGSIQQMEDYGQLLKDVAQSVDEFAGDDGEPERQKALATMVLMGINRIVVTNGNVRGDDDEPT